jgi:membrane-associated protease RseP (regulator of RpoE activity)
VTTTTEPSAAGDNSLSGAVQSSATDEETDVQSDASRYVGGIVLVGLLLLLGFFSKGALITVLVIAFAITMHEAGHFLTARWTGMQATEFFLGFGPRISSFRRGETEFGVKPVLLGAYVKITGMSSIEEVPPEDEARTYRQQSYPRRLLVASAGSLMHFAMALIALIAVFAFIGAPDESGAWEASLVSPDSAAASIGLETGDEILSIDGVSTSDFGELQQVVQGLPGEAVEIVYLRDSIETTTEAVLGSRVVEGETQGLLGITPRSILVTESLVGSVAQGFTEFPSLAWQSLEGIVTIFSNIPEMVDRVISPPGDPTANENLETRPLSLVGVVQIGAATESAFEALMMFALFNVFIGVFNLLPLLPLDGGHIAIATYERIREGRSGRRHMIDITRLLPMTYAVVMFLLLFGVGSLYLDIANPIRF